MRIAVSHEDNGDVLLTFSDERDSLRLSQENATALAQLILHHANPDADRIRIRLEPKEATK